MTVKFIKTAPPNSVFFVSDASDGDVPDFIEGQLVLSTPSMLMIRCLAFMDGETTVTLGLYHEVNPGSAPVFEGVLETRGRLVVVSIVDGSPLLEHEVPSTRTRIRVWANHFIEPNDIVIALG